MAALPPSVKTVVEKNARGAFTFRGSIATYDNDEHAVTFSWRSAAGVLSGEDGFDLDRYAGIGFLNDDLPLFVDLERRTLPVYALADGKATLVHRAFDAFAKSLSTPTNKNKKREAERSMRRTTAAAKAPRPEVAGPVTLPGPASVDWPPDAVVACRFGHALQSKHFLWFDQSGVKPKGNQDALLRYVRPQGHRARLAVGSKWNEAGSMKMDRGTGVWLDVSAYDRRTPVVTAPVKALFERIQPEGLEFLPVEAHVGKQKARLFVVNVTLAVPCLDVPASALPTPFSTWPYRQAPPRALVMRPKRIPSEPCFFRPAEYPEAILATRAMLERLREGRLSGIDFVKVSDIRLS